MAGELLDNITFEPLLARGISKDTCKHMGYGIWDNGSDRLQVACYYDAEGNLVAQKTRDKEKNFKVRGSLDNALPFGAQAWARAGKMLVILEGEVDALSMAEVQACKYPVWSIPCGADAPFDKNGKPLEPTKTRQYFAKLKNLGLFDGFETIVIMFDSDGPGRHSAKAAAQIIGTKARIAELPLKDANEMLKANRSKELLEAMWKAKEFRPEGVLSVAQCRERARKRPQQGRSWVFPELSRLTYGKRDGELYILGAGTGIGKTQVMLQDMHHQTKVNKVKTAGFWLEQLVEETTVRLAGIEARKPLHIPDYWDETIYDKAMDVLPTADMFLYDSFGANGWESIKDKIRYLRDAEGVLDFYIDNLTALVAGDEEEEKAALERIMADMGGLVKEKPNICVTAIAHLRKPKGTPHEEGGRVTQDCFKGSSAIKQWAHYMFGLERNTQAEDEQERRTTTMRCIKDRYTGRANGATFYLGFEEDTGLLFETTPPESKLDSGFSNESTEGQTNHGF